MTPTKIIRDLPYWLPIEVGPLTDVLDSVAHALPDVKTAADQMNAATSNGKYLEQHGALNNVKRFGIEPETDFVTRVLAIVRGRFNSRAPLEQHLRDVARANVTLRDQSSSANLGSVKLDGSHKLDGSWDLGGGGSAFTPGTYLVRFNEPLDNDLEIVMNEFERLRPMGLTPILEHYRVTNIGVFAGILGVVTRS